MGYPVSYRGARGPQRARPVDPDLPPLLGPLAGVGAAWWVSQRLSQMFEGADFGPQWWGGTDPTTATGWTLTLDCGRPRLRSLGSGGFIACGPQPLAQSVWEGGPAGPNAGIIYYWNSAGAFNPATKSYSSCLPSQRWQRGVGATPYYPGRYYNGGILLGGRLPANPALAWPGIPGFKDAAYDVPGDAYRPIGWSGAPWVFGDWMDRIVQPLPPLVGPRFPPRPVPRPVVVPRAIATPLTKEGKLSGRSGRLFFAMYMAFNALGDIYGLTRALWRSLIDEHGQLRNQKKRTPPLAVMLKQLWEGQVNWSAAALNTAVWKAQDTVIGMGQAQTFHAIGQNHGYLAARAWSTLDSAARNAGGSAERQARRSQNREASSRG